MGKNCLIELVRYDPERILNVYTFKKEDPLISDIQRQGISVKVVSKKELTALVDTESHQGFVATIKDKNNPGLKEFLEQPRKKSMVVMLDSIYDPQNLGAILRASECFGVDAVVWSKNRGVDITPVVSKASVGASEIIDIIKVSNLVDAIKKFKKAGYWVVAADADETAKPLNSFDFPEKTLLIMGSEGKGLRDLVSKSADYKVYIPMFGNIDSLNVSQATAVFLSFSRSSVDGNE